MKKILFITALFLLFCAFWVFAIYGMNCMFFPRQPKCPSVVISGAGEQGPAQVWEGQ